MATKRAAEKAASAGAGKKQKAEADPGIKLLSQVADGIKAADLPQTVKELLSEMMQSSLAVFKESRHKFQNDAIEMIATVLAGFEATLEKNAADLQIKVEYGEVEKGQAQEKVAQASSEADAKQQDLDKAKYTLADHAAKFKVAREAVESAQAASEIAEKEFKDASGKKALLESAHQDQARPLTEGTVAEAEVDGVVKAYTKTIQLFGFDESMLTALPTALGKLPTARGPFDTMVLKQLDEEVLKRVDGFNKVLQTGEATRAQHMASIDAAQTELDKAKQTLKASATAFSSAQACKDNSDISLSDAKQAMKSLGTELRKRTRELDNVRAKLVKHQTGPQKAFDELRERVAPPIQECAVEEVADVEIEASTPAKDNILEGSPKAATPQEAGA